MIGDVCIISLDVDISSCWNWAQALPFFKLSNLSQGNECKTPIK